MDYQEFSWKYIQQIIDALHEEAPVIAFGKGMLVCSWKKWQNQKYLPWVSTGQLVLKQHETLTHNSVTLQGNMDPSRLLSPPSDIKKIVTQMINEFGKDKYIVNLGHGILPNIPVDNAKAFIDAVKEYEA